jgi:hypothetical protein
MGYVGTYLALTAGLFVLFYLTGHAAARRLLPPPGSLAFEERLALRLVAGMTVWVVLLFALAALQLLRPWAIWSAIGLALAAGIWSASRPSGKPAGTGPPPALAAPPPWRDLRDPPALLLAAVLALVVAALWAQALRPIVAWDADVYHLTVPRLWLEHGGFRRIPYNVYSNWPLAVQMLFGLALTVKDHILATGIHFGLGVLLAVVAGAAAARGAAPLWGWITAALLLVHPVLLFEIRIAYVDVACGFFLFAGFLALHRALDDVADERRWLLAAGLACGLLAGSKINGIFGAAAIAAVYAGSRLRRGARLRSLARPLLVFAVPVAALWLPWLVKSWWLTGNPVYPLLYGVFGGPEWSAALGRAHREWSLAIAMGGSARDFLLLPFRVLFLGAEEYERFEGGFHPLAGILLPAALLAARREPLVRRALAVAGLWFLLWAATYQQRRYLIPVLPLLAVASAIGARALAARWLPRPALAARGLAAVLAVALVQANAHYLRQAPRLYAALWTRGHELRAQAADPVYAAIDRLPADAKLLFVNVNRGFWSRREYIADSFFEASQIAALLHQLGDREGIRRGLAKRGITHVLVERKPGGPVYPPGFVELLEDRSTRLLYRSPDGTFTLLELPAGPGSSS